MVIIAGCVEIEFLLRENAKMPVDNKSKILVVDDSGAVRSIVRKILLQLGFTEIDEAADGTAALAKINEQPYGLVISDWNMAPMNGPALLDHVRAKKEFNRLPFIMMTVEADQYKIIGAKYPGVTLFISKPFSVEDLQARIAQIDIK
jgi:two-component system chemotaxis response regulator CheY